MVGARFPKIVEELSTHDALGKLTDEVLSLSYAARISADYAFPRPGCATLRQKSKLSPKLAPVCGFSIREILSRGASTSEELDVLVALMLLGVSQNWPKTPEARVDLARQLLWHESHSGLPCLGAAERVLPQDRLMELAQALLELLRGAELDACEQTIAVSWFSGSTSVSLQALASTAREESSRARVALGAPNRDGEHDTKLEGDLGPRPYGRTVTALLAVTTLLFFSRASQALARLALGFKRPARLVLNSRGLELSTRVVFLGRVLRERNQVVPLSEIRQVEREVRYPRLGLYAGLCALTLGTLIGTRLFVEGLRVSGVSFTMMVWGLLLVLGGIGLDLLLSGTTDSVQGKCRLVVRTKPGFSFALHSLNPAEVDSLLSRLMSRLESR